MKFAFYAHTFELMYRVFIKYCVFFPRILESLSLLPRQRSAAIGCTEVSASDVGEGGVAVNCEKNTILPEHPVRMYVFMFTSILCLFICVRAFMCDSCV